MNRQQIEGCNWESRTSQRARPLAVSLYVLPVLFAPRALHILQYGTGLFLLLMALLAAPCMCVWAAAVAHCGAWFVFVRGGEAQRRPMRPTGVHSIHARKEPCSRCASLVPGELDAPRLLAQDRASQWTIAVT